MGIQWLHNTLIAFPDAYIKLPYWHRLNNQLLHFLPFNEYYIICLASLLKVFINDIHNHNNPSSPKHFCTANAPINAMPHPGRVGAVQGS